MGPRRIWRVDFCTPRQPAHVVSKLKRGLHHLCLYCRRRCAVCVKLGHNTHPYLMAQPEPPIKDALVQTGQLRKDIYCLYPWGKGERKRMEIVRTSGLGENERTAEEQINKEKKARKISDRGRICTGDQSCVEQVL
jgi:hypothetical protein